MLFADASLQFLLPFPITTLLGLLAAVTMGGLALGWLLGPSNPVARRRGLWGLRAIILLLIVLVLLALAVWWFKSHPSALEVRVTAVKEISTGGGGARTLLNASGYVVARREATVSSKVTGKVAGIH